MTAGTRPRIPPSRLLILGGLALVALVLVLLPNFAGVFADWWWFEEIGYQVVFTKQIVAKFALFLGAFVFASAFLWINLRLALRGSVALSTVFGPGTQPRRIDLGGVLRKLIIPAALLVGLVVGLAAAPAWDTVLQALHGTPFGIKDPVFGRDVAFYVFTLPALDGLLSTVNALTVLALIALVPVYLLRGGIAVRGRKLDVERGAGLHLGVLLALAFVLAALRLLFVDAAQLLTATNGPLVGAGYTDLHATLPALRVSAAAGVIAAALVLLGAARGRLAWYALLSVAGYALIAVVGRGVIPGTMQQFVVAPTELTREAPYLRNHITATRQAWGIDSVDQRELVGDSTLSLADLRANAPTLDNVRLWDRDPLLMTFGQLQEIRTYYDFVSVDDDRYWVDDGHGARYRQVLLSPRELNVANLPTHTFINDHLTFTHGYGLTVGPVNQVTEEGLPLLFIKDLPPVSNVNLKITRPQIYYGERSDSYVFTGTAQQEFDHPSGEINVYTAYAGTGGVTVGGAIRRLILATYFQSSKIMFSDDIKATSRVLYNRQIVERASKALPFLRFDRDPYMVIGTDGRLQWIMDAYTTASGYPYAEPLRDGTNYMRNSVKVVIDAYDGTVKAYVAAPADPVIRTWEAIFPGILQPLDRMPADLRAHLRYPDELYRIQATLYTTYHMDSPADYYHREDQWQIPASDEPGTGSVPFMRHMVMRLPEEQNAEYIYMVPFTPRGKDNLAAWMVARNDGAAYGHLRVYRLPRQSLVYGPRQIENRINQNTDISQQVTLWDQRGSRVIRGDLLVIPIKTSLLYVQPLYLQAQGGRIPELKRVVAAYQNQVVMDETLDGALGQLFGGTPAARGAVQAAGAASAAPTGASAEVVTALNEARRHYDAALQAQRAGDWARYGDEIRQLGEVLNRIGGSRRP